MTRDEITQIAVDANLYPRHVWSNPEYIEAIERFASLVAEKEREACAQLIEPKYKRSCDCESCYCRNSGDLMDVTAWDEATRLASAIRARGQKK